MTHVKTKSYTRTVPQWVRIHPTTNTVNMNVHHNRGCCADDALLYSQQKVFEGTLWVVLGVV